MVSVVSKLSLKSGDSYSTITSHSKGRRLGTIYCRSIAVQWPLLLPIIYAQLSASWAQGPAVTFWAPCAGWDHRISPGQWVLRRSMCHLQVRALNCQWNIHQSSFSFWHRDQPHSIKWLSWSEDVDWEDVGWNNQLTYSGDRALMRNQTAVKHL